MAQNELKTLNRQREFGLTPFSERSFLNPSNFLASPWQAIQRMQEEMDRLWSPAAQGSQQSHTPFAVQSWMPSVDISEGIKHWNVEVDLPGVRKDDVDVQVQDRQLIIRAEMRQPEQRQEQQQEGNQRQYYRRERRYGFFERIIPLPENVNEEQISCSFKDGVLTCYIPKTEASPEQQGRRIPINDASSQQGQLGQQGNGRQAQGEQQGQDGQQG